MSYILDALSKAAAERERGNRTTQSHMTTVQHDAPSPLPPARASDAAQIARWFYVTIGVVVLLIAALAWLLLPRYIKTQTTSQPPLFLMQKVALALIEPTQDAHINRAPNQP